MNLPSWLNPGGHVPLELSRVLLAICIAFLGGHVLAWVYLFTHREQPMPGSLVNALVVMPVLVALMMLIMQDNLITAFGMMGVFAIVRFRNVLSDTHDTTYVLSAIMLGLATGTQRFSLAIVGCIAVAAILLYLSGVGFNARIRHDTVLHLHWARPATEIAALNALLDRHGRNAECTALRARETGGSDLSFRLLLRDPSKLELMLTELRSLGGVDRLTSFRADRENAA